VAVDNGLHSFDAGRAWLKEKIVNVASNLHWSRRAKCETDYTTLSGGVEGAKREDPGRGDRGRAFRPFVVMVPILQFTVRVSHPNVCENPGSRDSLSAVGQELPKQDNRAPVEIE